MNDKEKMKKASDEHYRTHHREYQKQWTRNKKLGIKGVPGFKVTQPKLCPDCELRYAEKFCTYCSECALIRIEMTAVEANLKRDVNGKNKAWQLDYYKRRKKDEVSAL